MKFTYDDFSFAMQKAATSISKYGNEKAVGVEISLNEGNVQDGIVDVLIVTITSINPADTYHGEQTIVRTIEMFSESENREAIITTQTKESLHKKS